MYRCMYMYVLTVGNILKSDRFYSFHDWMKTITILDV